MITIHVHSVLLAVGAGGVVAAVYVVFPELWFNRIFVAMSAVPGIAVGYFCIGPTALLATSGVLPLIALAAWIYFTQSPTLLEPGWYYKVALVATVFVGAICLSAIAREESRAP